MFVLCGDEDHNCCVELKERRKEEVKCREKEDGSERTGRKQRETDRVVKTIFHSLRVIDYQCGLVVRPYYCDFQQSPPVFEYYLDRRE